MKKPSREERLERERLVAEAVRHRRAELRHDVIVRARGLCEWCKAPVPPAELHHLLYGAGRRALEERVDTLAFVCLPCHREAHLGVAGTLEKALAWAESKEFDAAAEDIQRRLDKIVGDKWDFFKRKP